MFWSQAQTYHSPIPELLERENVSLAELLEEEGLIQDTKSANGKLIEFLSHAEQISSLLTYIVEPFEPGKIYKFYCGSTMNTRPSGQRSYLVLHIGQVSCFVNHLTFGCNALYFIAWPFLGPRFQESCNLHVCQ